MQTYFSRFLAILMLLPLAVSVGAQESPAKAESFIPYELVGGWQFVNNGGTKYSGDIKVKINSVDTTGAMRGMISYDGRQTNDVCGTRGVFSDEPVEAEIIKTKDEYKISFMTKCLRGVSPRLASWTLTCEGATCTQQDASTRVTGGKTLVEKR